jgi:DamX protein
LPIEPPVKAASELESETDVEDAQSAVQLQRERADPAPVVERSSKATTVDGRPAAEQRPTLPAGPAPVEERLPPNVAKAPPPVAVTTAPKPPPVARRTASAADNGGIAWLKSRQPERYTLQLVGARERAAVEKFVRKHRVERPYAIFERSLNGRPWYSLVAGDYPDRDAAIAARGGLPNSLRRSDIWPRTFASVHESLK